MVNLSDIDKKRNLKTLEVITNLEALQNFIKCLKIPGFWNIHFHWVDLAPKKASFPVIRDEVLVI